MSAVRAPSCFDSSGIAYHAERSVFQGEVATDALLVAIPLLRTASRRAERSKNCPSVSRPLYLQLLDLAKKRLLEIRHFHPSPLAGHHDSRTHQLDGGGVGPQPNFHPRARHLASKRGP
ncbi:hypothetical protein D3C84_687510 [compost metagenome]